MLILGAAVYLTHISKENDHRAIRHLHGGNNCEVAASPTNTKFGWHRSEVRASFPHHINNVIRRVIQWLRVAALVCCLFLTIIKRAPTADEEGVVFRGEEGHPKKMPQP